MITFLVERTIPARLHPDDPADVALHCRWAADAYKKVGAFWLGGVVTEDRMYSLVTVEQEEDLRRYCKSLGIPDSDVVFRRVLHPLGPFLAQPKS